MQESSKVIGLIDTGGLEANPKFLLDFPSVQVMVRGERGGYVAAFAIPFAGLDYFDYDFLGRGQQINLFLAGAANLITWADPALGESRVDLSADLSLVGFASADRYFVAGEEREDAEIKSRSQSLWSPWVCLWASS